MQFIEFQKWGWNAISISFIRTIIFGLILGWGLFHQIKTIRKTDSAKSIPVIMSLYFAFHFFTFSVYGFRQHSLAMMINGSLGILWLGIYISATHRPDSLGRTKLESLFVVLPIVMSLMEEPSILMTIMFVIASTILLDLPRQILQNKNSGSVDPKFLLCFICSSIFWAIYSACVLEWQLFITNIFGIFVMTLTLYLCAKYKEKTVNI